MYQLLGASPILDTLSHLAEVPRGSRLINRKPLKAAYKRYLKRIQPQVSQSDFPGTEIVTDVRRRKKLLELFFVDTALNDLAVDFTIPRSETTAEQRTFCRRVEGLLERLGAVDACYAELLSLVINTIFYAASEIANGGTTSAAVGVIWAENLPDNDQDAMELLIHETTHTLMFIDELRYGHYTDYQLIFKKENYAQSSILALKRPLDKVVHSLVVATEVLLFRQKHLGHPRRPTIHPPTPKMVQGCLKTIKSIRGMKNYHRLFQKRGPQIIDRCEKALLEKIAS